MWDPDTGEWIEDDFTGMGGYAPYTEDDLFGGMFLPDLSASGKYQATDAATQGRMLGNMQKYNAIMRDPSFLYRVMIETGMPVFALEQLFQPGNPWLPDPTGLGGSGSSQDYNALAAALGGGGTGGGGGGGGGGGSGLPPGSYVDPETGEMVVPTPLLSSTLASTDPILKTAAEGIAEGLDPATVLTATYKALPDPELRKLYTDQVQSMFEERNQADLARMPGGAGVGEPSKLSQTAAGWGHVDPFATYGPGNLPAEVMNEANRYLVDPAEMQRLANAQRVKALVNEKDAVYSPIETAGTGVRLPAAQAAANRADRTMEGRGYAVAGADEPPGYGNLRFEAGVGMVPDEGQRWEIGNRPTPAEEAAGITPPSLIGNRPGWLNLGMSGALNEVEDREPNRYLVEDEAPEPRNAGSLGNREGLLSFLTSPELTAVRNNPRAPTVTRNGRNVRTNPSGTRAAHARAREATYRDPNYAGRINDTVQRHIGYHLEGQGRTPQRDAMQVINDYLRQRGITV